MFENIMNFFKKLGKKESPERNSGTAAKERLHLVLMQDRANVSADFLEMMKQEIIEVIKKYIDVDENAIDVRLTNKTNDDGTNGAPALYANIPIISIKEEAKKSGEQEEQKKLGEQPIEEKTKKGKEENNKQKDKEQESKNKQEEEKEQEQEKENQEKEEEIEDVKEENQVS